MTLWKAITSEKDIFCPGVNVHNVGRRSITACESLWPAISYDRLAIRLEYDMEYKRITRMILLNCSGLMNPSWSASRYVKA